MFFLTHKRREGEAAGWLGKGCGRAEEGPVFGSFAFAPSVDLCGAFSAAMPSLTSWFPPPSLQVALALRRVLNPKAVAEEERKKKEAEAKAKEEAAKGGRGAMKAGSWKGLP